MRRSSETSSSRPVNADGLEGEEVDLLGVVERELDDAAHLLVVDAVDDAGDGDNVDTGLMEVVNGLQLDVEAELPTLRCELAALPMPSNCR